MSEKYHIRDQARFTYHRFTVHFRTLLWTNLYEAACWGWQDQTACSLSSMLKQVVVRDTCSQTWKFFREAWGSLSSSLISNQAYREPMNNPDDISPALNRHTSARIVVVTHRPLASVLSLLCNYFLSETTAGIWPSIRGHHACQFEDLSLLHEASTYILHRLYVNFKTIV